MRYDAEHKQKTRERVLKVAAKAIREDGPDGIAVAGIMAEAGLTHGGFYAHFKSKDELVAAAVAEMFNDAVARRLHAMNGHSPEEGMVRYINFYLSREHRDGRGTGCPVVALNADFPRMTGAARTRYSEGVAGMTRRLAGDLEQLGKPEPEALAASVVAEMVGALALARAVSDPQQSDQILKTSRTALKQRLGLDHVKLESY